MRVHQLNVKLVTNDQSNMDIIVCHPVQSVLTFTLRYVDEC